MSTRPDGDFTFGGTLVDIGDICLRGRTEAEAVMPLGNTHGGIECCNGQWYVFYHRQTNRTNFSRQACAEKIYLCDDGGFDQAEVTSCGLNRQALQGEGTYPARICCHLTRHGRNVMSHPMSTLMEYPFLTQDCMDLTPDDANRKADLENPVQYVANIRDQATVGFKYFAFSGKKQALTLRIRRCIYQPEQDITPDSLAAYAWVRGLNPSQIDREKTAAEVKQKLNVACMPQPGGEICIATVLNPKSTDCCCHIKVTGITSDWTELTAAVRFPEGVYPLYFTYQGEGAIDFADIRFD